MIYPHYDICIWCERMDLARGPSLIVLPFRSQTSWIWLETKLVELGMVGSDKNYKASRVTEFGELFVISDTLVDFVRYDSEKLVRILDVYLPTVQCWIKPRCLLFSL